MYKNTLWIHVWLLTSSVLLSDVVAVNDTHRAEPVSKQAINDVYKHWHTDTNKQHTTPAANDSKQIIHTIPDGQKASVHKDTIHSTSYAQGKYTSKNKSIINPSSIDPISSIDFSVGNPYDRLPWKAKEYYHFAKDQDIKELIRNFCSMQGIDVILSEQVNDVVNGKFSNVSAKQFWKDIVNAYGLVWFYDGGMLYVYKNSEISSQVLQMGLAEMYTLAKVMLQLNFVCSNFSFRPLEKAGILVVSGPPKIMQLIAELSQKIIIERVSDYYDIKSFPLKHAWAYDMQITYKGGSMTVPGVASMLQAIIFQQPGAIGHANLAINITSERGKPIQQKDMHDPNNDYVIEKNKEKEQKNKDNTDIEPLNVRDIFITYDTRLNAVIVKAKPQDMQFIGGIIEQLDVPRQALRIDIAMVDISREGARKIGNTLNVNKLYPEQDINEQNDTGGKLGYTQDFSKLVAPTAITFSRTLKKYAFETVLNILENVGDAQTLSRSSVITLDNIAAVIDRSSTQYISIAGKDTPGLYDVSVSTKLIVVPHIIPGEYDANGAPKIKLLIEVTDGSWTQSPLQDAKQPSTSTESVNTEASVYEGQNLFIGGHFHEIHKKSEKGMPILKDIPIIGHLFKHSDDSNSVAERIYIISPSIVRNQDEDSVLYDRFFVDSHLSGKATLQERQFNLTEEYEAPSFRHADDSTTANKSTTNAAEINESNAHASVNNTESNQDAQTYSEEEILKTIYAYKIKENTPHHTYRRYKH